MLGAQLIGWQFPVTAVMLLLINVLGDGIPGICLAKEVSDSRIMRRKPIGRDESFFNSNLIRVIIRQTIVCSLIVWAGYYLGTNVMVSQVVAPSHEVGQSMSFLILGWSSILHVFNVRSRKSIFKVSLKTNMPMVYSAAAMIVVFALIVLIPGLGNIFGIASIGANHWFIAIVLSVLPLIVAEIGKYIDNMGIRQRYKNRIIRHRELDI
jgi:magnesium-transporting ATPase (P-type)